MTENKILEVVAEVTFSYPEDEGVSYAIPAGLTLHEDEAWCIRGVSGSGKSTLMTLLAALRRFQSGEIRYSFDGDGPAEVSTDTWHRRVGPALWGHIGFAFQRPELIRALNVQDNLALVLGREALSGSSIFDDKEWQDIASSWVWKISGGQVQRLGLLRAFGTRQRLVFLDEPTNNLDVHNRDSVAEFVRTHRRGRAMVVVSHDESFIDTLDADRIFRIREVPVDGGVRRTLTEGNGSRPAAAVRPEEPHSSRTQEEER